MKSWFKDILNSERALRDRVSEGGIQVVTVPHDEAAVSRSEISNNPKRQTVLRGGEC